MRKVLIDLLFSLVAVVFLTACRQGPVGLYPTGETVEVTITATRRDSAWVELPKSEYTRPFSISVGKDFLDFADPTWYERFRLELEKIYQSERDGAPCGYVKGSIIINGKATKENWISEIPTTQWLKENIKRGIDNPFLFVWFTGLPIEGDLQIAGTEEEYKSYIKDCSKELGYPTLIHIITEKNWEIYTASGIFPEDIRESGVEGKVFAKTLSRVAEANLGDLAYRFPDGTRYAVIHLPANLRLLTSEELALSDFRVTLTVPILQQKQ